MPADQRVVCPELIGRAAPLATAQHTLARARDAHGSTLLISGEAGIGKSRMVRETITHARSLGFVSLIGTCFQADRTSPYAPLLDLVQVLAATTSPALAAHCFAPAAPELLALFPELATIFPEATPAPSRDPEESRRRLHHAMTSAVHQLARTQPVLLTFEDVHWSDDATLDLLRTLARQLVSHRVVLALVFRNDEIDSDLARLLADLDRARCAADVPLRPLDADECARMLRAIFGPHALFDHTFVTRLHEATEGNPFFVEEMLKALVVAGDVEQRGETWRARPLDEIPIPRSATEAVTRRLAGLSTEAREVASVAAVAGRRFDFALVQSVTGYNDRIVLGAMKELVNAQLVVEESADRFAFRHALSRESLRTQLLARERVTLHRAIATAIEHQHGGNTDDLDDTLAYHSFEAGSWTSAIHYARRAAAHAIALGAPREALLQLDRAVAATASAGRAVEPALLLSRGRVHETLGAFARAQEDFDTALAAARTAADRQGEWEALYAAGMLWAARDYERACDYRRDALVVARAIGDPRLIARSLNRVGNWHLNGEDIAEGIPFHDEALTLFESVGDAAGVAETVDLLAMAYHLAGDQDRAAPLYERAITLFTALENRRGLSNAQSVLAVCGPSYHSSAGPVAAGSSLPGILRDEHPVRLATEIGWRAGEAFSRYLLADCIAWRGDFARAITLARASLSIAQEIAHREWQCGARRVLGWIALDLGDIEAAVREHELAHQVARQLNSATWIRWTGSALATTLVQAGEHERAAQVLREIAEAVPPLPVRGAMPPKPTLGERALTLAQAELALATGQPQEALALLASIAIRGAPRAELLQARCFVALEQWSQATAALDRAHANALAQEARSLLWQIEALRGTLHLERGSRRESRKAFDAARDVAATLLADLDDEALIETFREFVDRLAPPPPQRTTAQQTKARFGGLTRRERDAAALVAQGKSNRAIAAALGIGERTVEGYVAAALSKLGFASRAQLAVWAADRGLAPGQPS
ncbi:MAG: AAA family ATPase [Gemmatimonadota bacterium]